MTTEEQGNPPKSRGDTLGFTVRVIGELNKAVQMPVPDLVKLADVLREMCKSSDPLDWTVAELIAAIDIVENPGGWPMTTELKPCPFCGKEISLDDPDTLHPNGIGWKFDEDIGTRVYHSFRDVPKDQWCWVIGCPTPGCGCGAEVSGDSRQEAIDKWNTRAGS